jgi:hypothetical protein
MKPRDLFGVVIRCIGLLMLIGSLLYLYSAVVALFAPDRAQGWSPFSYIGVGVVLLLLSGYFLRGAPHLVGFAYRGDGHENAEPGAAPNGGPATSVGSSGVTEGPPSVS